MTPDRYAADVVGFDANPWTPHNPHAPDQQGYYHSFDVQTEAGAQPYRADLIPAGVPHSVPGLGKSFNFEFEHGDPPEGVRPSGITGTGGAPKVMGRISSLLVDALHRHKPASITFTAEEPSRRKLYHFLVGATPRHATDYIPYAFGTSDKSPADNPEAANGFALVHRDYAPEFEERIKARKNRIEPITRKAKPATVAVDQYGQVGETVFDENQTDGNTAMRRRSTSVPVSHAIRLGLLGGRVLHQGAGRPDNPDRAALDALGETIHFDPNHSPETQPHLSKADFDSVITPYVVNVLPPEHRQSVYETAARSIKPDGRVVIAARSHASVKPGAKWVQHQDGYWVPNKGSWNFQRGYTHDELRDEAAQHFEDVQVVPGSREPMVVARRPKQPPSRYSLYCSLMEQAALSPKTEPEWREAVRERYAARSERYTMTAQEIDDAVAGWREPSEAQRDAENYRKPRIRIHGLEIAIENPKGTRRKPEWPELAAHYGYVSRVAGQSAPDARDDDKVDVFVGPTPRSEIVFVIDQEHPSGRYDEPKAMLAFTNEADAKRAYLASYSPGHHCGTITAMTVPQFKSWLEHGDTKRRVAEQVSRYTAESSWDITPDHNPRRDIEQATSRARADCGTPPARYAESMSEQPNDLEHALQTVAARYNLSAADKRELLDRYCQEIAGPRPRNLEDDLEQVARELDLSPSEAAAVKRQYEARFAGDVERYAAQYDTIDDVIAGLNSDAINPARATQLARSLGHGKELRHNQQHPFHEAVRGYRKRNPGPPLTDEQRASIEESRRKAAKEDARDEMIGKQLAAAESELERRGAKLYYRSESGSGYWDLPDGRKLRLSDHSLPSTDSRDARFLNQDLSPWDEELVFAKGRGTEQHGIDRVAELFDQQPEAPNGPQDPGDQAGQ